jgi:hypothetical protein
MKGWDLTAGAQKLEMGHKALLATSDRVGQLWSDQANRRFVETYVSPLEPKIKLIHDALRRLAEVLDKAERQCHTEDG